MFNFQIVSADKDVEKLSLTIKEDQLKAIFEKYTKLDKIKYGEITRKFCGRPAILACKGAIC